MTSDLEFKVERGHSEAEGIAGRGTGPRKAVVRLEGTGERAPRSFPGVRRAGSSAVCEKPRGCSTGLWGTIERAFRKKAGGRGPVARRSAGTGARQRAGAGRPGDAREERGTRRRPGAGGGARAVSAAPRAEVPPRDAGSLGVAGCSRGSAPKPLPHSARAGKGPGRLRQVCAGGQPAPSRCPVPCEAQEGPARRCSDERACLVVVHAVPPNTAPLTVFLPLEPWSPDADPFSQLPFGGGGSAERNWEAWSGGSRGQSGGSRALAPPSLRRAPAPGSHLRPAAEPARRATPRGTWSGLRVLAAAAGEAGTWWAGGCAPGRAAGPLLAGRVPDGRSRRAH